MEWKRKKTPAVGGEKSRTRSIALGGVIHTDWVAARSTGIADRMDGCP